MKDERWTKELDDYILYSMHQMNWNDVTLILNLIAAREKKVRHE